MPQQIQVPGMGVVEFPDGMSDDQIAAAIKQNLPEPEGKSLSGFAKNVGTNLVDEGKTMLKGAMAFTNPIGGVVQGAKLGKALYDQASQVKLQDVLEGAGYYANPANIPEIASDVADYAYEKPVSTALNLSAVTGVGGLAVRGARAAGMVGNTAKTTKLIDVLDKTSLATDPLYQGAKAVGRVGRGAKNVAQAYVGGASGLHQGNVKQAAEAGYQSAYGGKTAERLTKLLGGDKAGDKEFGRIYQTHRKGGRALDIGKTADRMAVGARDKVRRMFNENMQPLYDAFRTSGAKPNYASLTDAIEPFRKDVFYAGGTPKEALPFFKEALDLVQQYKEIGIPPAAMRKLGGQEVRNIMRMTSAELKKKGLSPGEIAALQKRKPLLEKQFENLSEYSNNTKMTAAEFGSLFQQLRGSPEGLSELRRAIRDKGMAFYNAGTNSRPAKEVAGKINTALLDAIDNQFNTALARAGVDTAAYRQVMEEQAALRGKIQEFEDIFSVRGTDDATTRKVGSLGRDTAFTNYSDRLRVMQEMVDFVKDEVQGARYLTTAAAGDAARAPLRSTFFNSLGVGGPAIGLTASITLGNPLFAVMGGAAAAMHSPKLMGRLAHRTGNVQGLVMKPLKGASDVLKAAQHKWFGDQMVGLRGYFSAGGQMERVLDAWEENRDEAVKTEILSRAKKEGYNINERTADRLVQGLMTDQVDKFTQTLETIGRNKRLMKIFGGE